MPTEQLKSFRFQPGKSGNPSGRPLGLGAMIRSKTRNGEELVDFMIDVLRGLKSKRQRDQLDACNWLADRGFGKVVQDLALASPEGGPIQTEHLHLIAQMSKEELLALAAPRLASDLEHYTQPEAPTEAPKVAPPPITHMPPPILPTVLKAPRYNV